MSTMSHSPLSPHHSSNNNNNTVSPLKRKAMSITQTYYLAHTARGKLSYEASRSDHNLRLLVGHANLLDSLMVELAEAEREQESWFNQSVKKATRPEEPRHIQWADTIVEETEVEEEEEDWQVEDSDSESDYDSDEELEAKLQRVPAHIITSFPDVDEEFDEDEEDLEGLSLQRTSSHAQSPPELDNDSDSSSDDESMPPSPPSDILPSFSEKQREQIATTGYYSQPKASSIPESSEQNFFDDGFYLPQRTQPGLITAISVY